MPALFKKKRFWIVLLIVLMLIWFCKPHAKLVDNPAVQVTRGDITAQALAVGTIEPQHSITVTSTIPGRVSRLLHREGDAVKVGDVLLEIAPNTSPQDLNSDKRDLEKKQEVESTFKNHLQRLKKLRKMQPGYVSLDNLDSASQDFANATLDRKLSEEKFALDAKGTATINGQVIHNTVISPVNGYILTRAVDVGDPVVPQTSSQAGNPLFTIANMDDLVFKGQVNEIDVGKLHENLPATIVLGAYSTETLHGVLSQIALQSYTDLQNDSANVAAKNPPAITAPFNVGFQVVIDQLQVPAQIKLRAGYSANANIEIQQAHHVLMIPERLISFENDKTFVFLQSSANKTPTKHEIVIGITDGIHAEIKSGLKEGDMIVDNTTNKNTDDSTVENG